jgi:mRNA-degrading endonuclease toxin of MazEF toxin-antitoxin module
MRPDPPRRYEVYLADLYPFRDTGRRIIRPVVVVSGDEMNRWLKTVLVCLVTSRCHPRWKSRLPFRCAGVPSEVAADQVHTIGRRQLLKRIDRLGREKALALRLLLTEMYGE